ncbi:MAG: branched-chain amino acid ABC transporter permease [Alphaproteobacteria bacterium]|nr:branched-chain amino acid ABC transporter permease [Alphaproteobacteria bacterium]
MFYREAGQYKASYGADQAIFPIAQDRFVVLAGMAVAFLVVPFLASEYTYRAVLIPTVILTLAAIGLNVLMGYCGQVSLGSGAFMGVGAYAAFNLAIRLPFLNPLVCILLSGFVAAAIGIAFGIPSLRIKGFYLACATLAAQFFGDWAFLRIKWVTNHTPSGSVNAPPIQMFGYDLSSPTATYLIALTITIVLGLAAKNIVRGHIGRQWMAIRDMDIAAEIIGVRPLFAKLSAFAVSSFLIGVAGAMWAFLYLGSWEPAAFSIDRSFQLMFMVIIGGLGSILGSALGAIFIVLLPIFLNQALPPLGALIGWKISTATVSHFESMIFGALIVFFLVVEPHGLARLWSVAKEKLRLWPFPH